jgi:hypothetical protein
MQQADSHDGVIVDDNLDPKTKTVRTGITPRVLHVYGGSSVGEHNDVERLVVPANEGVSQTHATGKQSIITSLEHETWTRVCTTTVHTKRAAHLP